MSQEETRRAMPGIGIANTVRFAWRSKETEPIGRESFGRTVLMGTLKLTVKEVLCFQDNPLEKAFDVTLYTGQIHDETMKKAKEVGSVRPLCNYEVTSLAKNNFRVVTVNIYNPHVKDEDVRAYLGRFMDNVSSARHLRDSLGFWTGRRGFQALLREDPRGEGGYLHPPAMFSLGADRGTLHYARQPPFCRRCMAYGHTLASCSTRKCRFCGSDGHEARDCAEPKACHGCGSVEHLWRDCPARQRSYASAAGGGARAGDGGRRGEERAEGGGGEGGTAQKEPEREEEEEEKRAGTEGVVDGTEGVVVGTEGVVVGTEGEGAGTEGEGDGTEGEVVGAEGLMVEMEGEEVGTEGEEVEETEEEEELELDMGQKEEVLRMVRERVEKKGPVKGWKAGEYKRVIMEYEKEVREKGVEGGMDGRDGREGEVEGAEGEVDEEEEEDMEEEVVGTEGKEEKGKGKKEGVGKRRGGRKGRAEERRFELEKRLIFGKMWEMEEEKGLIGKWEKGEYSRIYEICRLEGKMIGKREFWRELGRYEKMYEKRMRMKGLYEEEDEEKTKRVILGRMLEMQGEKGSIERWKHEEVLRVAAIIRKEVKKMREVEFERERERYEREFEKEIREENLNMDKVWAEERRGLLEQSREEEVGMEGVVGGKEEEEGKGGKRKGKGIEEGRVEERRLEEQKRLVYGKMLEMEKEKRSSDKWGKEETSRKLERCRMEVRMMGNREFRMELVRYEREFGEEMREKGLYVERDRAREKSGSLVSIQKKKKKGKGEPVDSGRGIGGGEGRGEGEVAGPSGVSTFLSAFSALTPMEEQD